MQRRYWTVEEDEALRTILQSMPEPNWTIISLKLNAEVRGSDRNAKQCRQRWLNKIRKNEGEQIPWSSDQDRIILQQFIKNHKQDKNKWITISDRLSKSNSKNCSVFQRTANEIKNRFYSVIRKGVRRINNKLGRPIQPEEIRLIKPITISKLLDNMEIEFCRELIQTIYSMAQEVLSERPMFDNRKLEQVLNSIISQNREHTADQQMQEVIKNVSKGPLKSRKSSLSTLDQQKVEKVNLSISNTFTVASCEENREEQKFEPINNQCDEIDLFLCPYYMGDSCSLQFEEIDFGI